MERTGPTAEGGVTKSAGSGYFVFGHLGPVSLPVNHLVLQELSNTASPRAFLTQFALLGDSYGFQQMLGSDSMPLRFLSDSVIPNTSPAAGGGSSYLFSIPCSPGGEHDAESQVRVAGGSGARYSTRRDSSLPDLKDGTRTRSARLTVAQVTWTEPRNWGRAACRNSPTGW